MHWIIDNEESLNTILHHKHAPAILVVVRRNRWRHNGSFLNIRYVESLLSRIPVYDTSPILWMKYHEQWTKKILKSFTKLNIFYYQNIVRLNSLSCLLELSRMEWRNYVNKYDQNHFSIKKSDIERTSTCRLSLMTMVCEEEKRDCVVEDVESRRAVGKQKRGETRGLSRHDVRTHKCTTQHCRN